MIGALALALGLALAAQQQDAPGTIRGLVRSEATGARLPAASVEIRDGSRPRTALTDSAGSYLLRNVAPGRRVLRASHVGYEPLEIEVLVVPGREVSIDLSLRLRPVRLGAVTVRGRVDPPYRDTARVSAPTLGIAGMRALEATPGIVELGLADGAHGAPGQAPVDPSDVLFIRGVPSDLKLLLLDGAPVYTPFHVGGLLESFEADVLSSATLYLGGAPARYDGGLSYILELSTRSGGDTGLRSSGAVDMMSARFTTEGAAGERIRYLFGGRGVHGFGIDPLLRGSVPISYGEGLARLDASLGGAGVLSLTGFRNREGVSLHELGHGPEVGWGNTALSLRWRGELGSTESEVTAALGSFHADVPTRSDLSFPAHGESQRVRLTADFAGDAGPVRVRYGASFDRHTLQHEVHSPPASEENRTWDGAAEGAAAGSYVEGSWQPAPRVRLRAGLRGDLFFEDPGLRIAPRLSLTFMLSDRAALTAAGGRYHQYVRVARAAAMLGYQNAPDTLYLPIGFAVDQATHFNLALHQELEEEFRLGIEGFFKTFEGQGSTRSLRSHVSGVDLWVRRDAGRVRGWLGYSLSWIWSASPQQRVSEEFAGRQLLNAGIMGPLGRFVDLDLRFAYGAGLPFSALPLAEPGSPPPTFTNAPYRLSSGTRSESAEVPLLPQEPSEPYLRLDLGISRNIATRWRGMPIQLMPYLKVLNSLDRRDGMFYWSDERGESAPRAIATVPVLPVAGLEWRF